jgi:hypothetical protein
MLRNRQPLIPYLLLVAALAAACCGISGQSAGLERVVTTGRPMWRTVPADDTAGKRVGNRFRGRYADPISAIALSRCLSHHPGGDGPGAGNWAIRRGMCQS